MQIEEGKLAFTHYFYLWITKNSYVLNY